MSNLMQILTIRNYNHPLPTPELELASNGPGGDYSGAPLGRYELVPGEQINGSPVYKQAHSKEVPTRWRYKYKLHRWDEPLHLHLY